jgi:hypothetical protein
LKDSRRLTLKREALSDLTSTDLQAVVGGYRIITDKMTECLTPIIDPSSNTWPCSDGC